MRVLGIAILGLLVSSASGGVMLAGPVAVGGGSDDVTVYADALAPGWQNWSWGSDVDLGTAAPVHNGAAAIAVSYGSAWAGLYLHVAPVVSSGDLQSVRFWVHGGSAGGQRLSLVAYGQSGNWGESVTVLAVAGTWTEMEVPLAALGSPAGITGLVWQDATGGPQPTWYLDDVVLEAGGGPPPSTPGAGPALSIDIGASPRPISPDIYGISFASEALARELRLPLRRWGGNHTSRYNWQIDTSNRGSDWYFENIPQPSGAADSFVVQDRRAGTRTILTVPLIGWVAGRRLEGHPYDCGFKVSRYGGQQSVDPWDPDCGSGVRADGSLVTGNDPADTSVVATPGFVQGWVEHLVGRFGNAAEGGVAYFALDNEPMLWSSTHRDVHPEPTSYDEMRERTIAYATAVKVADPTARTLGPVVWGWVAYFWSDLDRAAGGRWWENPQDRLAHGGVPFLEWFLREMAAYQLERGVRLLDLVDVHFYPPGVALASAGDAGRQALRLRSTRLLWDRSYTEESWIGEPVYLVPRLRELVASVYPGTGTAVTEYNWGALDHINGALAEADVLGIFGREGLDVAVLWGQPAPDQPGAFAFRMYRNVDGEGQGFGEISVRAQSEEQDKLSVYAALRSDGALTVMVINKTATALTSTVTVEGFTGERAVKVWRYGGGRLDAIIREDDHLLASGSLSATFPAQSIVLLVAPESPPPSRQLRRRLR